MTVNRSVPERSFWRWGRRWAVRIVQFGLTQAVVQVVAGVAGLVIIRTLSKPQYAFFVIANSMQMTGNMLADLGVGIGVRSIGGRVWEDPQRFGQLVNTALGLRRRLALLGLGVALPAAAWMLTRNGASPGTVACLCAAGVAGVLPLLGASVWTAALLLHGEYRRLQRLDLASAGLRLGLLGGLALGGMNALLALLAGVAGSWVQLRFVRRWGRLRVAADAPVSPGDRRELLRLSWRWLPNVIFFCFQAQLTLLLLSMLGNSTGIADLTALGRVAALFALVTTTFTNVLAPRFARCQDPGRLPRLYLLLAGGAVLVLVPVAAAAWVAPGAFLWLLGPQYAGLGSECGWVIAAGCLGQFSALLMALNSSKAWLRYQSWGFIPAIIGTQLVVSLVLDLRQFHNLLLFNFATAAAPLPFFVLDAVSGLRNSQAHARLESLEGR